MTHANVAGRAGRISLVAVVAALSAALALLLTAEHPGKAHASPATSHIPVSAKAASFSAAMDKL